MAGSNTRTKLVDVARMLFAKNGLENTTMNDIALASKKGRRTLYTYFKNKEDIYFAVIEAELERLSDRMTEVAKLDIPLEEKLVKLIFTHLEMVKEAVLRNGNLRAEFFRNIWVVEKVRKRFDQAEINTLQTILTEGVNQKQFDVESIPLLADIIHYCVKGLEVPYIYGRLGKGISQYSSRPVVMKLVHRALGMQEPNDQQPK